MSGKAPEKGMDLFRGPQGNGLTEPLPEVKTAPGGPGYKWGVPEAAQHVVHKLGGAIRVAQD